MKRNFPPLIAFLVLAAAGVALLPSSRGRAADAPASDRKPKATFEVYQDKAGEYRWRLRSQNTKVLCTSSEGYKEKRTVLAAIESVKRDAVDAPVVEQPAEKAKEPGSGNEPAK